MNHAKSGKLRVVRRARVGLAADKLIREAAARIDLITLNMDVNGTDSETYWALRDVRNKLHATLALPVIEHPHTAALRAIDGVMCDDRVSDLRALVKINALVMEALNAKA